MSFPDSTSWSTVYPWSIPARPGLFSLASGPSCDLIINWINKMLNHLFHCLRKYHFEGLYYQTCVTSSRYSYIIYFQITHTPLGFSKHDFDLIWHSRATKHELKCINKDIIWNPAKLVNRKSEPKCTTLLGIKRPTS